MDKFAADLLHSQNSLEQSILKIAADQERQGRVLEASASEQQSVRQDIQILQESILSISMANSLPPQQACFHSSHFHYYLFLCLLNWLLFTLILRAFPSLQHLLL